jgi:hypothetical protein
MISLQEAKSFLSRHGTTRAQSTAEWNGPFHLPLPLRSFYEEVGPVDITVRGLGNDYFFPSLSSLWKFQAGYRYNSETGKAIEHWRGNWLVVADEGGDPFIFDSRSGNILHAVHGLGAWAPKVVFPNLASLAGSLANVGSIVVDAGIDLTNESGDIKNKYLLELKRRLTRILDEETVVEGAVEILGWQRYLETGDIHDK